MLVSRSVDTRPAPLAPRTARRGFTLGELVVALLLFSLVGGGIMTVVMRQQRFYRSTADVMKVHGQLRQGASVLPLDLRMVSTSDTLVGTVAATRNNADFYAKGPNWIEFRRIFGSSIVCAVRRAAPYDTLTLYPKATDAVDAISSWGITPAESDSVLVLDDWTMVGPGDDRWRAYEVKAMTAVTGVAGCPWKVLDSDPMELGAQADSTSLLYPADTVRSSYKLVLANGTVTSPTIIVGAPVRFFRRVRYELFQAPDQKWYLGYMECTRVGGCSEMTPVSGPYSPATGIASEDGIRFAYFDSLGNALAMSAEARRVARVDVVMRAVSDRPVTRSGAGAGETYRDSVVLSIAIRNRR